MSISKERREHMLEIAEAQEFFGGHSSPVRIDELRTLLDMADERDRYWALLVEAVKDVRANMPYRQPLADEIDAALEGKSND